MCKYSIILFTSFNLFYATFAQYQNVFVSNTNTPNEVSIMINPKNPNQIVIGSNSYYTGYDTSLSAFYYTTNGGFNWTYGVLHSTTARPSGDPVILVDTSGYFHFLQNANYNVNPHWWDRELIMKSTDGGITWSNGEAIGTDTATVQDKPWGCVDLSNSQYRNHIYVTWTRFSEYLDPGPLDSSIIMFSKSSNGSGYNWSDPVRLSQFSGDAKDSSNTMEGVVPCVGPNGEIYVSWAGPRIRNQQYVIFFDKSTDGGASWLDEDIIVTEQPGGWSIFIPMLFRCNGMPVTCCDISNGPYRGNIYINWSDQRNGVTDCDIWFIKSTDGGVSWSQVKRVNDDPPGKNQFYTWMTVDQVTGYIYVVFYDQRNTTTLYANVYVARSTDAGETFQNVRINTTPVNLNGWIYDYIGISAYNGKVRPVWMGSFYSIYTAIIDSFYIGIKNIGSEVPEKYLLYQNYPNPFNPITTIRFEIPSLLRRGAGVVMLKIYDILGREIASLIPPRQPAGGQEGLQPGTYEVQWDATNYPSGVYYYRLISGNFINSKRMVLIK